MSVARRPVTRSRTVTHPFLAPFLFRVALYIHLRSRSCSPILSHRYPPYSSQSYFIAPISNLIPRSSVEPFVKGNRTLGHKNSILSTSTLMKLVAS